MTAGLDINYGPSLFLVPANLVIDWRATSAGHVDIKSRFTAKTRLDRRIEAWREDK